MRSCMRGCIIRYFPPRAAAGLRGPRRAGRPGRQGGRGGRSAPQHTAGGGRRRRPGAEARAAPDAAHAVTHRHPLLVAILVATRVQPRFIASNSNLVARASDGKTFQTEVALHMVKLLPQVYQDNLKSIMDKMIPSSIQIWGNGNMGRGGIQGNAHSDAPQV